MGGFTTFSAFGVESFQLIGSGEFMTALIYMSASVIFGMLGIWLSQLIVSW
jgi:CrcB protein|tara:strand:+ start:416 stop:568 length:153 start_codon:yes stop_codon:yes gene_type:complete